MSVADDNITTGNTSVYAYLTEEKFPLYATLKGTALTLLVIWTIAANSLVFIVLKNNPRLQTVPNLLVGNLAFSDLCLGIVVLPLSSVYAIAGEWLFNETLCVVFVSADILCSTASIWNLSIVGLDRYWAITSPVVYMSKRNKRTAGIMILLVWASSALISLAPLLGWKQVAISGNYVKVKGLQHCTFLNLPSYTIYSATGSFFIPTVVMFFVYFKIYQAFAKHRARRIYRQKVIRKHIESTILHDISHVLPTSDEFTKDEDEEESESSGDRDDDDPPKVQRIGIIIEEDDDVQCAQLKSAEEMETQDLMTLEKTPMQFQTNVTIPRDQSLNGQTNKKYNKNNYEKCVAFQTTHHQASVKPIISYEKINRQKQRKERMHCKDFQKKPKAISAAKERRGVKVLGIILGCFTVCWTPFFIMYVVVQFCKNCNLNPHIEMFITWLGYSNSAMNPIIYTVFNRDYQNALKRLFTSSLEKHGLPPIRAL